jgi:hypothetical protein
LKKRFFLKRVQENTIKKNNIWHFSLDKICQFIRIIACLFRKRIGVEKKNRAFERDYHQRAKTKDASSFQKSAIWKCQLHQD